MSARVKNKPANASCASHGAASSLGVLLLAAALWTTHTSVYWRHALSTVALALLLFATGAALVLRSAWLIDCRLRQPHAPGRQRASIVLPYLAIIEVALVLVFVTMAR